jgi:two-component system, chemotaxis family, CheB/CheR fusion protein
VLSLYASEIVNTVRQPIVLLDRELCVRFANSAFYHMFRLERAEAEGQVLFSLRPGDSDLPDIRALIDQVKSGGAPVEGYEIDQHFPSLGGRRVFLLNARLLYVHEGADPLILLAAQDVTAERIAAEATTSTSRQLGRNNVELRRSNDALAQFAQIASHDLQEPLRKIRTYGDMLRDSALSRLTAEELDLLDRATGAAGRAQRLIADVLALARVSSQEPVWKMIDIAEVVRGVISDLELQIGERGAVVEVGQLPKLEADAAQLRQVFQNLVSNALKFVPATVQPIVRLSATALQLDGDAAYHISVSDNGIGFEQHHAASIFEPFQRLHPRGKYDGTGMGLAICKRVAEQHGGSIRATSRVGEGSEFTITLPARRHQLRPVQ